MKPAAALSLGLLLAVSALGAAPQAFADDDAKINARIASWGRNCKNAVSAKYPKLPMSDIAVELGATLKQSIDSGETTLKVIKKSGLSYNWTVKKDTGYCNTDGSGNVTEVVKF